MSAGAVSASRQTGFGPRFAPADGTHIANPINQGSIFGFLIR